MAAIRITELALLELRKLVHAAEARRPVVSISWQPRQADNKRGSSGANVWTFVSEGQWVVGVLDYEDPEIREVFKEFPTQPAYGFEFWSRVVGPAGHEVQTPELDYEGTTFVVRDSAI
jgi:hypothetical protein